MTIQSINRSIRSHLFLFHNAIGIETIPQKILIFIPKNFQRGSKSALDIGLQQIPLPSLTAVVGSLESFRFAIFRSQCSTMIILKTTGGSQDRKVCGKRSRRRTTQSKLTAVVDENLLSDGYLRRLRTSWRNS